MKKNIRTINTKKYIEQNVKIIGKDKTVIPFILNKPQLKLYNAIKDIKKSEKPVRIIVLKARQMGFSTLTEAVIFKETATKFNVSAGVIAHKDEATTNLFNMYKTMYYYLPDELKPAKKNSNAKELLLDNKDGTGLNSRVKCMTAGGLGIGRSDTFTKLHLSEFAFWTGDKAGTLTGILQAVPNLPDTMVIIESTANGFDYFRTLWYKAVNKENDFIPVFVGWNEMEEYSIPYTGFKLTPEEVELQELYNLTLEQISWRRWCLKNNCGGDIEKFRQEYPINPEEAFISTGTCVFDKEKVVRRIKEAKEPLAIGTFEYTRKHDKIKNIKFIEAEKGFIKIYQLPRKNREYCIGGDTSGEGSDYFTAHVLDARTGRQVATLKHKYGADQYAELMYCLGKMYNYALIGIEANFDTYPIRELERLGYDNQFVRKKEDTYTGKIEKAFGFRTDRVTRPLVISNLISIVREQTHLINDVETLLEMLTFVKNEQGRAEAMEGEHDDLVMALAIAYYIIEQVEFKHIKTELDEVFNFKREKKPKADQGEKIQVI